MKKITKKFSKGLFIISLVALFVSSAALAADPPQQTATDCTISSDQWNMNVEGSLPQALYFAAQPAGNLWRKCTKSVKVATPNKISMCYPLPIAGNVDAGFTLDGDYTNNPKNPAKTVLDASQLYKCEGVTVEEKNKLKCAIVVYGSGVTLKNLSIQGIPDGYNGICYYRPSTSGQRGKIDNVSIMGGDAAIHIADQATNVVVVGNSEIIGSDVGLWFNTDASALNYVDFGNIGTGNENGFATIEKRLNISGVPADQIVKSDVNMAVTFAKVMGTENDYYVQGQVGGEDYSNLKGILVYGISQGRAQFYGIVGKQNGQTGGLGFMEAGKKGSFNIRIVPIDVEKIDGTEGTEKWMPEQIIFVPLGTNRLGQPTTTINLSANEIYSGSSNDPDADSDGDGILDVDDNCAFSSNASQSDSDGDGIGDACEGSGGSSFGGSMGGYVSEAHCRSLFPVAGTAFRGPGIDSDGDGLDDDVEDANHDCRTDGDKTSWLNPDTDNDGIMDGVEYANGLDPIDPDFDKDGVFDGAEDRFIYFEKLKGSSKENGYLFHIKSLQESVPLKQKGEDGEVQLLTCDSGEIGVKYKWYRYRVENGAVVELDDTWDAIYGMPSGEGNWVIEPLACRHRVLVDSRNFNGKVDTDNLELNPKNPDTDGDGYSDGSLKGVQVESNPPAQFTNDGCPLEVVKNEQATCTVFPCSASTYRLAILGGVDPKYLEIGEYGAPVGFKKDENDDVILFKDIAGMSQGEIKNVCFGDIDEDGIPNCVENGSLSGSCEQPDPSTGMSLFRVNSDGDNADDAHDFCPTEAGSDHLYTKDGLVPSCATTYYRNMDEKIAKALCKFRDVDGDKLFDCDEDKDMDGVYSIEDRESDPFKRHSDSDLVDDYIESRWGTNALLEDTDADGLNDGVEVHADSTGKYPDTLPSFADMGKVGCAKGFEENVDTDGDGVPDTKVVVETSPLLEDTDGDGMKDGEEVDGDFISDDKFLSDLLNNQLFGGGRYDIFSNPRSADSDGDGLLDGEEVTGTKLTLLDSNPCMLDSDGDGIQDNIEERGCRLNPDPLCKGVKDGEKWSGPDSDSDGLPDKLEALIGTDANNRDSDGDSLMDGEEDANGDGILDPDETDPLAADTDMDGLSDGVEAKYSMTNPRASDSDGDGCTDGQEDMNQNGIREPNEPDPNNWDSDGDQLPDCWIPGKGGEDRNKNGQIDKDETDWLNPDSDYDGKSDFDEVCSGDYCNFSEVHRALSRGDGCSLGAASGSAPGSIAYLMLMLLAGNRAMRSSLRRKEKEGKVS